MGSQDKLKVNLRWVYFPVLHTLPSTFLEHANYIRCRLKKKRHSSGSTCSTPNDNGALRNLPVYSSPAGLEPLD